MAQAERFYKNVTVSKKVVCYLCEDNNIYSYKGYQQHARAHQSIAGKEQEAAWEKSKTFTTSCLL